MNKFNDLVKTPRWLAALVLAALVAGCGGGGGSGGGSAGATVLPGAAGTPGASATDPTVVSATPANLATNVPTSTDTGAGVTGRQLTATFSQPMDPVTINSNPAGTLATFTLKETVAGTNVPGTVAMNAAKTIATFTPTAAALLTNTNYTATVTTAAKNLALGTAMAKPVSWTFTTNAVALTGQAPVNLGTAGNFAILAKSGISKTGVTQVTGNIGVSPNAASFITGFTLAAPPTSSTTATEVVGLVFASDYDPPTPINIGISVQNMETAFTDAAGRAAGVGPNLNLGAGTVAGQTLAAGVYTWGSNVNVTTNLTLNGTATDVWIFQITGTLDLAPGAQVLLTGGALAKNIFWQVADTVTLLAGSHLEGIVLAQTNVLLVTGATINGRLLSQTAVDLQQATVTQPAP